MTFLVQLEQLDLVWAMGDIGVEQWWFWLNIIAIILLTKVGVGTLKDHENRKKKEKIQSYELKTLAKNADV